MSRLTVFPFLQLPPPCDSVDVKNQGPLSVLEVSDPKICILAHLMSPLEPIDPIVETPLNHPLLKQRSVAAELLTEVQQANTAIGGMLLANMERNGKFVRRSASNRCHYGVSFSIHSGIPIHCLLHH